MISNSLFIGLIFTLIVSVAFPVACIIYCIKKAGTRGIPFIILLGLVIGYFANNIVRFGSIFLVSRQISDNLFVMTFLIALFSAACYVLAKVFAVKYVEKSDIGLYKGLAIGSGFTAGHILMQANEYFTTFNYLKQINAGTFLDSFKDQTPDMIEQVKSYQEAMLTMHSATFFLEGIQKLGLVFFHIALILILVKYFCIDKKRSSGIIYVGVISFGYEFIVLLLNNLGKEMNEGQNETVFLILSAIISIIVLVGSIMCILKLMKQLPVEKSFEFGRAVSKPKTTSEDLSEKRAWQEIRQLNTRNINRRDEKVEDNTEEHNLENDDSEHGE